MRNIKLDVYDASIMVEINRRRNISVRALADRLTPGLKKTQVGARIKDLEELGMITIKGKTKGSKRNITDKGIEWLRKNGYVRSRI